MILIGTEGANSENSTLKFGWGIWEVREECGGGGLGFKRLRHEAGEQRTRQVSARSAYVAEVHTRSLAQLLAIVARGARTLEKSEPGTNLSAPVFVTSASGVGVDEGVIVRRGGDTSGRSTAGSR